MTYDRSNIFARILRGEIPCQKVYEDDFTLAFHDIFPKAPTHILVIPKGEYTDIVDFGTNASAEEVAGFYKAVAKIASENNLVDPGFRTIVNTGVNGGQEVPHLHIHLLAGKRMGPMLCS